LLVLPLLLCFLLLPRAPPSPLFPYTTLFRSSVGCLRTGQRPHLQLLPLGGRGAERRRMDRRDQDGRGPTPDPDRTHRRGTPLRRDRKSTRLNSSHVSISYAVFCLKKKNSRTC